MRKQGKQPQLPHDEEYRKLFGLDIYLTPVFSISSITIVVFVVGSLVFQEAATEVFKNTREWITINLDWFFLIAANLTLLFCLYVACSPLGKVRLGGADAKPEYSNATWFAMLFAAGVGIGLLFYGVAEPLYYFQKPPLGIPAGTEEAAAVGIAATVFHWGLHGWSIYGLVGLALGYFAYNRGLPLTIRSAFYPLFGDRIWGWPGHIIDTVAIFAGLFGLATSLGLGVKQVTSGLNYLFGVPATNTTMVVLIVVITSIALTSVLAGINVGIKRLSQFNIILALLLLLAVIVLGPTLYIFRSMFAALGSYLVKIVPLSNWVGREDVDFLHGWTTFYFAWWFAWAPFVGTFIARISKGRTVREFIIFVLIPPTLALAIVPDEIAYFIISPDGPGEITINIGYCFEPSALADPMFEYLFEQAEQGVNNFNVQDIYADEMVQIGLASVFAPRGRYSWQEETLAQFNRWLVARYERHWSNGA